MMRAMIAVFAFALAACAAPAANQPADQTPASGDVSIPPGETGGICGGIAGFRCLNDADYCEMEEGVCSSIADGAGRCAPKPEACTMDYRPVCGCDGETYSNACSAAAAGVSVASKGECGGESPATE